MPDITDPAFEFAELCRSLRADTKMPGAELLAKKFKTEPWSREFYQILFAIVERGHYLDGLVEKIAGAEHIATMVQSDIRTILQAFNAKALGVSWSHANTNFLGEDRVRSISILSAVVRPHVSYPKLSEDECEQVIEQVDQLLIWLKEHQISEQDFIRQALIDGLSQFRTRLERVQWLGYGYAIEGLRDVIGAYFALERSFIDDQSMPVVEATLKKMSEGLKSIYNHIGVAKDAVEKADFLLKAYGAAALYTNANVGGIAGLLTFEGVR